MKLSKNHKAKRRKPWRRISKIAEMKEVGNRLKAGREARLAAIQELIPIALTAVSAELQREVSELAGHR